MYWVDGNWDDFGGLGLRDLDAPAELAPVLVYVPRGTVLELGGLRVGLLGGAESLDGERSRARGVNWWPDLEGVTDADVTRLVRAAARTRGIDLLVAHAPPAPTVEAATGRPAHPPAVRVHQGCGCTRPRRPSAARPWSPATCTTAGGTRPAACGSSTSSRYDSWPGQACSLVWRRSAN